MKEDLTLSFFNEKGALMMIFAFDRQWQSVEDGQKWAEQILGLPPTTQYKRFSCYVAGALIESAGRVLWHDHQKGSTILQIDCDYSKRLAAHRRSAEKADHSDV